MVTHVPSILERLVPRSAPASPPAPALGGRDSQTANEKVISAATIVAFVVLAGVGVCVLGGQCGRAVRSRADEVAGAGYLSADEDPETALPSSAFDDVLSALRDHDPALGAALDAARANLGMGMGTPSIPGNVITDFPDQLDGDFHTALRTRLVTQTTKPFWEQFQKLADHITAHGSLPKPSTARELHRFVRS
jgi:hypothetical protein